ncbi:cation diffusion facilitator family transporter [Tepidibacillus fermentans]|uniref:Cation diffusion facilitator family transporter n=1 Tax=Tepidibacillus fermentans TaxID=1281767 RepID=A0A4R3KA84_9BACI|nr:cation diffusion facilitator family transporter [Tepidibacillus fermentans]TCS79888.1 cation diffusion facilitator family transporter [Tepidibacillus fermentans]
MSDKSVEIGQGELGSWISIISYISLAALKLFIGYLFLSKALVADGLNNTTDIVGSIAVLIGFKIAKLPPDPDHTYGHYRAETIASMIASLIMLAVGINVVYQSIQNVFNPSTEVPSLITAWVALVAAIVMYIVYRYNIQLAERIKSDGLKAVALDNRSDAMVSIGAAIGIIGSQFGFSWLDPLAALIVGIIIIKTAWEIFRETSHNLSDGYEADILEEMKAEVDQLEDVKSIIDIKARKLGSSTIVDVTIGVDPTMNVAESHQITEVIEEHLMRHYEGVARVHVHVEPVKESVKKV